MKNVTRMSAVLLSIVMLLCFLPSSVLAEIGELLNGETGETVGILSAEPETEEASPYVLGEIIGKRTETSKTFRMSDGSFVVAEYGKKVHFADENGELQDYDNTLSSADASLSDAEDFSGVANAESDVQIKLANNSNSNNLLKIQKDEYKVSVHPVDADKTKAVEVNAQDSASDGTDIESAATLDKYSSGAVYKDIYAGVDFEYIIYGNSVKENIIVKEALDSYTFTFELKIHGLTPSLQPDGSVTLCNEADEVVFVIPKGVMYDSNGESSDEVGYTLTHKNGKKYILTVTASEEWINAEERVFPVTVDPTFTPADNGTNTEDVQISDSGTVYSYTATQMTVGYSGSYQNQVLIKAKSLSELPDSAVIVDAKLNMYKASATSSVTVNAYTVTEEWSSSTVTWGTKPDYDSLVVDYININSGDTQTEYVFDITKTAQYWYESGDNNGILLAPGTSTTSGKAVFYSSDSSNKPKIEISYRDTKGLESRWTYSSQSAGNAGTGYVNGFNGNLVFVHNDITTEGSVIPLTVSHVYNDFQSDMEFTSGTDVNSPVTSDYSAMKFGKGWKLSIQQSLVCEIIDGKSYYVYNDSDGTEHYFTEIEGRYVDEDGNGLVLTLGSDENVITNEYGVKYTFDSADGKLLSITDVHGNKKTLVYEDDGTLSGITFRPVENALVRQLAFAYNSNGALSQITNVYNSAEKVKFLYSETISGTASDENAGYLREIRYYNGTTLLNTVYYEYYEDTEGFESLELNGKLKSARDGDTGYTVIYKYDKYQGRNRVRTVEETVGTTLGQVVAFGYGDKLFTVETSGNDDDFVEYEDNIITTTLFDDYGAAICSYSTDYNGREVYGASYAEYMPYESASETNYKVKTSAVKGITNNNIINNPNCESSTGWTSTKDGTGYSTAYTTTDKLFGNGSLKLSSTSGGTGLAIYSKDVYLPTAGTYTLSAYVKATDVVNESGGAYIRFGTVNSEILTSSTNTSINNGWRRLSATVTVTSACYKSVYFTLENCKGTVYIDCAQVEKCESPSEFNFVENGGFESVSKWSGTYTLSTVNGSNAATVTGSPTAQNRLTQTVYLNSPLDTTFMLSGFAKADSVSLETDETRKFGITVTLNYSDSTTSEHYMAFNADNVNLQYASLAVVPQASGADVTVTSAVIAVCYDYNANTAYFDNVTFTVEPAQTYAYDSEGNMTSTVNADGNESVMSYYDNGIDLKDYTAITGESFEYEYDSKHQVTKAEKTVNGVTQTAEYDYDSYGNTESVTLSNSENGLKVTSSATYSEYGNYLTQTVNELGKATNYSYDSTTKLLEYIENANSVRTAYTYDNRYRTEKVYLDADEDGIADTAEAQVSYLYANNRLSGIDTATTDYTLTYDIWGNIVSVKAGDYTLATYEYAANNGKLLKLTYGNGDYEEYVYDHLERITEVTLNGVSEYVIAYNANGNICSITENDTTHVYEYDSLGRLIRAWQTDSSGNVVIAVENTYDDLGRAKGSAYALADKDLSYSVTYKTDSNLVSSLSMPRSSSSGIMSAILYDYDEFERLTEKEISLSSLATFYEDYGYYGYTVTTDDGTENRTTSLVSTVTHRVTAPGGTTTSVVYSYTYDNLGNITQVRKDGTLITTYAYDSLGQLLSEYDYVNGLRYSYAYDKSGNITAKTTFNLSTLTTVGTINYAYGNSTWGDLLTSYNGTSITYDEIGNPANWRNAVGLTWEARELQRTDLATNSYVNYTYNSDGIRTSRSYVNSNIKYRDDRTYVLDGTKIIQEDIKISTITATTNATLYYLYDVSGEVQGFIYNNSYYYFQKNLQGDVVRILDYSGNVVVEYTYDAWGNILTTTGTLASTVGAYNPFRYRSYYYDTETGFYYLQSRYYDPTVGRFLNADVYVATGQGIVGNNMFAYCGNNPVMRIDADGDLWEIFSINVTPWLEMIFNHDWGAVHRKVQNDIASKYVGIETEVSRNGGRMDLYRESTNEVWEVKHGSNPVTGIISAYFSLFKYVDSSGPYFGENGSFSGCIYNVDLGDSFSYYYNIVYWTPVDGVVLYSFERGNLKETASKNSAPVIVTPKKNKATGKSFISSYSINNHKQPDGARTPGIGGIALLIGTSCLCIRQLCYQK